MKLIDAIIDEPLVGAHRDKESAIKALGTYSAKVRLFKEISATVNFEVIAE